MRGTLRRIGIGLAMLAASGLSARGADQEGGGAAFRVDTESSRVYVKVGSATRLGHDHGVVGRLSEGAVTLGGGGDLRFAMKTFVSDRPEARRYVGLQGQVSASDAKKTTETMLGPDVMDATRYPTARYAFGSAVPTDGQAPGAPGHYRLEGVFTLHGVSRKMPLEALVEKTEDPGVLRMRCAFAIAQSHFGMRPYKALGGLVGVEDRLEIWGDLLIRPAPTEKTAARSRRSR